MPSTLKAKPKAKSRVKAVSKRKPAVKSRKKPTKLHRLLRLNRKGFAKKKFLLFLLAFVVIGAGYMAYRSFAYGDLKGADGEFTAVSPSRILDTRDGTGGVSGPLGTTAKLVQVTGKGGIPATGVKAVVMNATVTQPSTTSQLVLWASGKSKPTANSLSYVANQTIPSQVTVEVGSDGKVNMATTAGTAQVIFDVVGYISSESGSQGTRFVGTSPTRILDTRTTTGGVNRPINTGTTAITVRGVGGVPASAKSVVMNVTVTEPTAPSFLAVWPSGEAKPLVSSLNFGPNQTIANMVTVKIGSDGKINIANNVGNVHVIFDVAGYYTDEEPGYERTQAGRFVAIAPQRFYDSRTSGGAIGPAGTRAVDVTNKLGVENENNIDSVVMNVTTVSPTAPSFLTLSPQGKARPLASNINFGPGQSITNQVIVKVGHPSGQVEIFNNAGNTHVIVDIVGYIKQDLDGNTTFNAGTFYYLNAKSKLEYNFKINTMPNSTILTTTNNEVAFTGIDSTADPSFLGWNVLDAGIKLNSDGVQGKHTIQFVCSDNAALCKSTMPGIRKMSSPGANPQFYDVPYNFVAGTTYKFTEELLRNTPGYPGLWSAISITGSNGVKQQIAIARVSTAADKGYFYGIDTQTNHYTKCATPTPYSYSFNTITADGAPVNLNPHVMADDEVFCPGNSKMTVDTVNGTNGVTISSGLAKAARDTTPPTILSITPNAAKTQLSVSVKDNDKVTNTIAYVDNQSLANSLESYFYQPQVDRVYDTSAIAPGAHNLTVYVVDNSGNLVSQTVPFNK
jgi:hypothetical protein